MFPPVGLLSLSAFIQRGTLRFDLLHFLVVLPLRLVEAYLRSPFITTCTPVRSVDLTVS